MYENYGENVDFYLIYTKEAHASDSNRPNANVKIKGHTSIDEREAAAESCLKDLKISIPVLVDDMKDSVATTYSAHPDRLFIINAEGKIAYRGDKGPRGFNSADMEKSLKLLTE